MTGEYVTFGVLTLLAIIVAALIESNDRRRPR